MELTAKRLREILHYDPETGIFLWRVAMYQKVQPGDLAGTFSHGYWQIGIDYKQYRAHRLAWLYMTGRWPRKNIDHKDKDRAHNAWANLREATHSQNSINMNVRRDSKSKKTGVDWRPAKGKWRARITVGGVTFCLGHYVDFEPAKAARIAAEVKYFGEFAP
jgi:HNH endonuclease